jgi:hypothetical protein
MGERAIVDKGMETLAEIGTSPSTTFVLPQELTSLVGRYGKHLSGGDVAGNGHALDSLDFDEETRELLGLDDVGELLEEFDAPPARNGAGHGDGTAEFEEDGSIRD